MKGKTVEHVCYNGNPYPVDRRVYAGCMRQAPAAVRIGKQFAAQGLKGKQQYENKQ